MNEQPHESTVQPVASENMPSDQPPLAIESGVNGESLHTRVERTFNLAASLRLVGCAYTYLSSKYLDHDRRLVQRTSAEATVHTPLHPETYETWSLRQVA